MRVCRHSLLLCLLALAGCAQNPYAMQGQMTALSQQQTTLAQQNQQLQSKASTLDHDNQELETLLAQSRQQNKLLQDQLAAIRDQLQSANQQLAQTRDEKTTIEKRTQAALTSSKGRAGATITPNNSLQQSLPSFSVPGVEVRQDGDVIRIELPSDKMFDPTAARLRMDSTPMIDTVVAEIDRSYPGQFVGIEGHTDSDPPAAGSQWLSNHQLSAARAQAVFDYLAARTRLKPRQLFIVGHGGNHPIVSNGTAAGKSRNRRIELAIYPDRVGQ
jgi:chemotaxis protein MotB